MIFYHSIACQILQIYQSSSWIFFYFYYIFSLIFLVICFVQHPLGFCPTQDFWQVLPLAPTLPSTFGTCLYFLRACTVERQLSGYSVTLDMQLFWCIFNNDFATWTYIINLKSHMNILIAISRQKNMS